MHFKHEMIGFLPNIHSNFELSGTSRINRVRINRSRPVPYRNFVAGGKNEIYYVVIWTWKTPPARAPVMPAWAHAYNRSCYCTSMPVDFPSAKLAPLPRKWVGEDIPTVTPDRISFSPEFDEQIVPTSLLSMKLHTKVIENRNTSALLLNT